MAISNLSSKHGTAGTPLCLIFETLAIPRAELEACGEPGAYFESVAKYTSSEYRIHGSFPTPAHLVRAKFDIAFDSQFLNLHGHGEHCFYSDIGAFKILAVAPASTKAALIKEVFSFVARNSVHACSDHWSCYANGVGQIFDFTALARKLFFSDQPLMLHCGPLSEFTGALLKCLDVPSRVVHFLKPDMSEGHVVLEAFDDESGLWMMLDADYGVVVEGKDGALLSTAGIFDHLQRNDHSFKIIDCGQKHWLEEKFDFSQRFTGPASWSSNSSSLSQCAEDTIYRKMLDDFLHVVVQRSFHFGSPWKGSLLKPPGGYGAPRPMPPVGAPQGEPTRKQGVVAPKWTGRLIGQFFRDSGCAYVYKLHSEEMLEELLAICDTDAAPTRSTVQLLEDGVPLGPAHAPHANIRNLGCGAFSHWKDELLMSASDNSDPNANGRNYVLEAF